jgi:Arsenate reductase and related proteins, glutaredoxin family
MADFTIYHNPRCTKSRETLRLLQDKGIEPRVIEYLKEPPTAAQLKTLVAQLGINPSSSCARAKRSSRRRTRVNP